MTVRTLRLAVGNSGTGSEVTIYTCPSGKTAIIKDVRCSVPAGSNTRAVVAIRSGASQVAFFDVALGVSAIDRQGFVVLEPGDQVRLFATGAAFIAWLSGAELDGVAP